MLVVLGAFVELADPDSIELFPGGEGPNRGAGLGVLGVLVG